MLSSNQTTPMLNRQKDLYVIHSNMAYRLDGRSGRVVWQHPVLSPPQENPEVGPSASLQVIDQVVYIQLDLTVSALTAETGQEIWQTANHTNHPYRSFVVDRDRVYLYSLDTTVNHPRLSWETYYKTTSLSALNVADGSLAWHNTIFHPERDVGFCVSNGTIYAMQSVHTERQRTDEAIYALDAASGTLRWHYALPQGFPFEPPLVARGMVYLFSGKIVLGLDEREGKLIWEWMPESRLLVVARLHLKEDILLVDVLERGFRGGQRLFALDAQTGKQLWATSQWCSLLPHAASSHHLVPVACRSSGSRSFALLDVKTGEAIWQTSLLSPGCFWSELAEEHWTFLALEQVNIDEKMLTVQQFQASTHRPLSSSQLPLPSSGMRFIGVWNGLCYFWTDIWHAKESVSYVASNLATGELVWSFHLPCLPRSSIKNTRPAVSEPLLAPC